MNKGRKKIAVLLSAAVICLALSACGTGDHGIAVDGGTNPSLPATVFLKTGTLATDSWGYTGTAPAQLTAPDQTAILIGGHTLLEDAAHYVVSGVSVTKVSFSIDPSTLPAAARNSAPGTFLSYVNLSLGAAASVTPALSVTVEANTVPPGTVLTAYNFNPATGTWGSPQTAVVDSSKKVTFAADKLALWGIFQ
jgi:hypothetical protein